jgi:hypothetical protein
MTPQLKTVIQVAAAKAQRTTGDTAMFRASDLAEYNFDPIGCRLQYSSESNCAVLQAPHWLGNCWDTLIFAETQVVPVLISQ